MNNTNYRRLREEDRGVIYRMNKEGKTQSEIAYAIGFSQSSVSKELRRNKGGRGYRPQQAQKLSNSRQATKLKRRSVIIKELADEICERLQKKHSPEQISGRLKKEGTLVSHETIYKFIALDKHEGGALYTHLRINSRRRYRHRCKAGRVGKIPQRVDIENRPLVVEDRTRFGDWEADLIEGSKGSGYLLSIYERKSQYGKLCYIENKGSDLTAKSIIKLLKKYKVKTITYDNGLEFAGHLKVNEKLATRSYFCKPYHSWEKGGVENYNGLVRQYFPKGSNFKTITTERLRAVEKELNLRPRKGLNFQSPEELKLKFKKAA